MKLQYRIKIMAAPLGALLLFGLAGCATDYSLLEEKTNSREAVEYADEVNTDAGQETPNAGEADSDSQIADEDTEQYWYVTEDGKIIVDDEKKAEDARYAKEVLDLELSGEYVIDYQVREEPIPKEIADIGNPCEGSIHAFPTRIEAALSEIEMAKDPELREAVEYAGNYVLSHLEQETGEKFVLQDVRCIESIWCFDILEVDTGEYYEIYCVPCEKDGVVLDGAHVEMYTSQKNRAKYIDIYSDIVSFIYPDSIVWVDKPDNLQIFIEIINFSDTDVNRMEEQEKCIALWKKLREEDENARILLGIRYIPMRYRDIMEAKRESPYQDDVMLGTRRRDLLIQTGEMLDYFYYCDLTDMVYEHKIDEYIESDVDVELPFWANKEE